MRPLHLTLSAFGSYAGRADIDMNPLGREGLYLICGDTGAGKSTIFDGICFALYGQTSGAARRDGEVLRSEMAPPGVKSFVELCFEHAGQRYTLWRSLKYERPALRGAGLIQEDSSAAITLPDGTVLEGKRRVNEKVEDILHLKYEHFSRIMMIAQGEFSQLLMADTEARGRILQKICDTSRHRALQTRLAEDLKALEALRLPLMEQIKGAFAYAQCGLDSASGQALKVLKAEPSVYKGRDLLSLLDAVLEEDGEALRRLEDEEKRRREQVERLNQALARHEALKQAREALAEVEKALTGERERLPQLNRAREALLAQRGEMDAREAEAARLQARLPDYLALDKDIETLERLQKERGTLQARAQTVEAALAAGKRGQQRAEKEMAELAAAPEQLLTNRNLVNALLEKGKAAGQGVKQAEQLMEEEARLHGDQARLEQLAVQAQRQADELSQMRRDLLLYQAGILASGLKEGEPCPVCGATHHPDPAPRPREAPGEEQLRAVEAAAARADKAAQAMVGQVKMALGRMEAGRALLERALSEQKIPVEPDMELPQLRRLAGDLREQLRLAYQRSQRALKEAEDKVTRLEQLQRETPRRQRELEEQTEGLNQLQAQAARLEGSCAALAQAVAERRQALPYAQREQAQSRIQALEQEVLAYRKAAEAAALAIGQCLSRIETNQSQKESLAGRIEKQTKVLDDEEEQTTRERYRQAEEALRQGMGLRAGLLGRLERNGQCAAAVRAALDDFEALEKRCEVVRSLADTACGRLKGCDKLTFERYIQVSYFERVLTMANQRFLQMTLGQYELERAEGADTLRAQAGLELNVINHFTGTRRSVKSLSGGESFMASLSLALGFADVIRHEAGGVVIDALFIDEGFGALDEAALDQVLTALTHLTGGGKLIGIISHVPQLRERIEKQIVVRKGRFGSSVQVLG